MPEHTRGIRRCTSLLTGWTLLLATACTAPDRATTPVTAMVDTAGVREIIDSLRARFEAGVATGDMESLGSVVASDVIAVGPDGPAWDSLRAASDSPWPPGTTLDITPLELRVLSDEWAYELGTSVATWTPPGSNETRTLRDMYLVLFRKTPEGWKLYREVATSDLPENQR